MPHETGFYYTVEKGDTLWGISKRFSDAPRQWPDLWEKNREIRNPHRIFPGQKLLLYQKSGQMELPPAPLEEPPYFVFNFIDGVSFITTEPIPAVGEVVQGQDLGNLLGEGDVVYVRPSGRSPLAPGNRFTAYRKMDPTENLETRNRFGFQYLPTAVLEIVAEEEGFFTARVVNSYDLLLVGDLLVPYQKRSEKIPLTPTPEGLDGTIIGSQKHDTIIGDKTLVFIDKGASSGVQPGQYFNVVFRQRHPVQPGRKLKTEPLPTARIGTLLVLHAEKENATALVTQASRTIEPGYRFQSPPAQ